MSNFPKSLKYPMIPIHITDPIKHNCILDIVKDFCSKIESFQKLENFRKLESKKRKISENVAALLFAMPQNTSLRTPKPYPLNLNKNKKYTYRLIPSLSLTHRHTSCLFIISILELDESHTVSKHTQTGVQLTMQTQNFQKILLSRAKRSGKKFSPIRIPIHSQEKLEKNKI